MGGLLKPLLNQLHSGSMKVKVRVPFLLLTLYYYICSKTCFLKSQNKD